MQYKVRNVTMNIDVTPGDYSGDCRCYIPFTHKKFIKDACGMEKNDRWSGNRWKPLFYGSFGEIFVDPDYLRYWTTSPDLLIAYMSWLMTEGGEQSIDVEYERPFWAIHDAQHAINDEAGCSVYVDEYIELERLHEAFKLMIENDYMPDHELCEEVAEAYNARFGKSVCFLDDYYYPYLELEDEEEYAYD